MSVVPKTWAMINVKFCQDLHAWCHISLLTLNCLLPGGWRTSRGSRRTPRCRSRGAALRSRPLSSTSIPTNLSFRRHRTPRQNAEAAESLTAELRSCRGASSPHGPRGLTGWRQCDVTLRRPCLLFVFKPIPNKLTMCAWCLTGPATPRWGYLERVRVRNREEGLQLVRLPDGQASPLSKL